MGNHPVDDEDASSLQTVLAALEDPDCRSILESTKTPMTAKEISNTCEIPKSTVYRKLEHLSNASLVRELVAINPNGGRTTRYQRNFEDVVISMDESDELSLGIKRPTKSPDERLASLWSEMSDEV